MKKLFAALAFLLFGGLAVLFVLMTAAAVIDCIRHRRLDVNDAIFIAAVAVVAALTAKGAAEMALRMKKP